MDRFGPKAQMRYCLGTGFFRIIDEIALRVHGRAFTDDLNGIFIRADCPIRAKPEKDGPDAGRVFNNKIFIIL